MLGEMALAGPMAHNNEKKWSGAPATAASSDVIPTPKQTVMQSLTNFRSFRTRTGFKTYFNRFFYFFIDCITIFSCNSWPDELKSNPWLSLYLRKNCWTPDCGTQKVRHFDKVKGLLGKFSFKEYSPQDGLKKRSTPATDAKYRCYNNFWT